MNHKKQFLITLILVWLAFIWGNSLQPYDISSEESGFFLTIISEHVPFIANNDMGMYMVRKLAHFTEYFILSLLVCNLVCMYEKETIRRACFTAFAGLFIAFIDETIQIYVPGRAGVIKDVWIDFSGVVVGTLVVILFLRFIGHSAEKS